MSKKEDEYLNISAPDLSASRKSVMRSEEDLKYGVGGIVRILSGRGRNGKCDYFFEGFNVVFSSEVDENIDYEEVYLDHKNLKIIIKLPDPNDISKKESIRHAVTMDYVASADDLKSRAALVLFEGLTDEARQALIEKEKKLEKNKEK